jgi:hypothetical protein
MSMQEAPDGRIFFVEIAGKVKVFDPKSKLVSEIGSFTVTTAQENGLLGIALDPEFAKNQWIYFLHSPVDYDGQFISRFTLGKLPGIKVPDAVATGGLFGAVSGSTLAAVLPQLDAAKVPSTLPLFGNTSCSTSPLTMADQLGARLRETPQKLVLCGFGVGLSWGTVACEVGPIICPAMVEI